MNRMPKIDAYEQEMLDAFEKGKLESVATKAELARLKAAARATDLKDRRVNIPLSSGDLSDIQVKALEEGIPYQTLITSVCTSMSPAALRNALRKMPGNYPTAYRSGVRRLLADNRSPVELDGAGSSSFRSVSHVCHFRCY